MDIRNWGQTFMARIKQLPSQANGFAHNLPNSLNDLPKTMEDGAKAVLANEQVAEGWKTVGQGVGQLTGWKSSDQVNLSDAAKGGAKPEVPTATPDVPNPEPATDPVGKAVQDAASGTPKVTPAPQPVTPAPDVPAPAADPVGKAVQSGADTPATTVTKTVRRARAAKEAGRVATGAKTTKAAKAASDAGKAVVDAKPAVAEGPLSLTRLEAKPSFNNSALDLTDRASLLRQMGHKEEAKTLSTFADKLQRAGTFYDKNNKLISSRMLHAQEPLGLNNSELQAALKTSTKANELGAAFDVKPASQPFSNAARRMYARAEQLKQLGHPAEATKLSNFADRLSQASEQAAKGQKAAAFKLFHRSFTPDTQAALKVSNQADEVYTAFSQEPQAAAKATKTAAAAGEAGKASKAVDTGRTAASASRVAKGAKAAKAVAQAGGDATTVEVTGKAAKSAKAAQAAAHAGEARGIINAGKAAKGAANAAADAGIAANAAADAGTAANAAGDAGKAVANAATDAGNAAKDVAAAGDAGKAVEAGSGAAKGVLGGIKGFFGKIGNGIKGFFGRFTKGAGSSGGWATIKDGFAKMLPGLGKAIKSSAIFSAVFSIGTNLFDVLRGKKTVALAVGTVFGDTLGGAIGGVFSALASGAAIAALGALGVVGLPLTLAAGAVGILGYMGFDHFFRNSSIYDSITHLFT